MNIPSPRPARRIESGTFSEKMNVFQDSFESFGPAVVFWGFSHKKYKVNASGDLNVSVLRS